MDGLRPPATLATSASCSSSSASCSSDSSVLLLGRNHQEQQKIKAAKEVGVLASFQCSSALRRRGRRRSSSNSSFEPVHFVGSRGRTTFASSFLVRRLLGVVEEEAELSSFRRQACRSGEEGIGHSDGCGVRVACNRVRSRRRSSVSSSGTETELTSTSDAGRNEREIKKGSTRDTRFAVETALKSSPCSTPSHSTTTTRVEFGASVLDPGSRTLSGHRNSSLRIGPFVECLEITGGSILSGEVKISGAKNSSLAVLAGALCSEQELCLRRIPDLHDVRRMFQVLQSVGVQIQRTPSGIIKVDASNITSVEPCPEAVRKLRASFFVIGALVGRQGEAIVPLPGGCNIGARPIDLHVRGLEALGAQVEISIPCMEPMAGSLQLLHRSLFQQWSPVLFTHCVKQGKVHARATNGKHLVGGNFCLDYPSVGATETLMMAAALADGKTMLSNVAQEPEVVDLADFLTSCGASIHGAGTNTLNIEGRRKLHGTEYQIIPDRIEAGTFLIAAAITRSTISISPVVPTHLTSVVSKLRTIGCHIQQTSSNGLWINTPQVLRNMDVKTLPYPGFPTDLQPQLMSLLTTCSGQSIVEETVFENRMRHVEELQKLGANVKVSRSLAIINGKDQGSSLYGAPVLAADLRAGAALVLAGMAAEGTTHIEGVSHIDRGYEKLDHKLCLLGASIQRLPCLPSELTM